MKWSDLMSKKIGPVPVLYIVAGFVAILAVMAWRMKPASEGNTGEDASDAAEGLNDPYDALATNGTVVVAPTTPEKPEPVEVEKESNEQWGRRAAEWLYKNNVTDPASAQLAINKYLNGDDLTYDEGQWRNKAIGAIGYPPEPLGKIAISAPQVFRKQMTPPGRHTVKGNSDNTYSALAKGYYGRDDNKAINLLQGGNSRLGETNGPFKVGELIYVPAWREPIYFTATTSVRSIEQVAARNGISTDAVKVMNEGMSFPVSVGTKVRVK